MKDASKNMAQDLIQDPAAIQETPIVADIVPSTPPPSSATGGADPSAIVAVRWDTDRVRWELSGGHEFWGVTDAPVKFDKDGFSVNIDPENLKQFLSVPQFVGVTAAEMAARV